MIAKIEQEFKPAVKVKEAVLDENGEIIEPEEYLPAQEIVYGFYVDVEKVNPITGEITIEPEKQDEKTMTELNDRIAEAQARKDAIAALG